MKVLLLGAGKIGRKIATYLSEKTDYSDIIVADVSEAALAQVQKDRPGIRTEKLPVAPWEYRLKLVELMTGCRVVISAMHHSANPQVAEVALDTGASYFDLTEDVDTTDRIIKLAPRCADRQIFMPQCGLAPGFVSIMARHLFEQFDIVDSIHLRVGALPQNPENRLKYSLTWSTDGLINEYSNPCDAVVDHKVVKVQPLDGMEHFSIEGTEYEAFNTSGGLGTLCTSLGVGVREMNYKTLRYPGHRDLMQFLLHDLKFTYNREELKTLLDGALPTTKQDVVIIYCTATGWQGGKYVHLSDVRRIYGNESWSAIQITTASSICAVVDLYCHGKISGKGLFCQENVALEAFLGNRFGKEYAFRQN